jgi:multidrug efflux pump subunit AcrA (membrane-fusion protein)
LEQSRSEVAELEETTRKLRNDLVDTEKRLAQSEDAKAELENMQARVRNLEAERENLQTELEIAKSRGSTAGLIEETAGGAPSRGAVGKSFRNSDELTRLSAETKVKSISAENGLIVLETSPEMGLAAGQKVSLISNLQALATLEIAEVKDSMAVANILPGGRTTSIGPGSKVQLFR